MANRHRREQRGSMGMLAQKTLISVVSGLLILVGACAPSSESRQQQEAEQNRRTTNIQEVRTELNKFRERGRLMNFAFYGQRELEPVIFDYISRLGGTLVSSGYAEFEIEVTQERNSRCPRLFHTNDEVWLQVAAKIYDLHGLRQTRNLILVGESAGCFTWQNENSVLRPLTNAALYNMRF
jgi:hypothetical protein